MCRRSHGEQNASPPWDRSTALDALFRVFADQTRRHVIRYLRDSSGATSTFDDLVRHVTTVSTADRDPEGIGLSLYHEILPKLEAIGMIEYDARSEMVRYRGHPAAEYLLDCVDRMERESLLERSGTDP